MRNLIIICSFLFINSLIAQTPNWSLNENEFEHTMSLVSFINLDGKRLSNKNDKLGVFVNDQCRGVTNLIYVASEDKYYAYLTVFSNTNGEELSFKVYNSTEDTVTVIDKKLNFEILAHYGNLQQAYSIAKPALSNIAVLNAITFKNIPVINYTDTNNKITIEVKNTENIAALTPIFNMNKGASVFYKNKLVTPSTIIDFTDTVEFIIVSEDQSKIKTVQVKVAKIEVKEPRFFRKNEVCDFKGVIKVEYAVPATTVLLKQNGNLLYTSSISKGKSLFEGLNSGAYQVEIDGIVKTIIIK
ncbi:hypothetical protein J2Q11_12405 [Tenacibaculum finnmarkense genomovar finnmarkense]|uniref:hypothetical protein n=1 Tax=Tenacibaculum finnmarkense TaxID=2781243 RepID=UPI001E33D8DE|nr:hypothetical protein [Tenacibaculum finnmarkense]MCD8418397.1 hypothetical protein [Tenacibaculum finnmarkense genomovar finnmarkense]MCG8186811.1 hypothetical protein [Tenacibaculum finnmarkense genomovar finnmarkense]MCG8203340.1 hypothetical protein [Tenacibaculum finnmarkense genomovar finnmarkense]MCG8210795.1 hypothetical protein [Tenacibaculum finnmarkense genomovar finnmarkense]MCG8213634.1 hypothetical protein [Tenacibaculum finnmarkense genomovar finnmarkense]